MAEDSSQRSEEASPRRREKAREEGQVASSRDLTAAVQFSVAVAGLAYSGGVVYDGVARSMRGLFRSAFESNVSIAKLGELALGLATGPLSFVWSLGAALLSVSLLMHLAQTGFLITPKRLAPDLTRLNPAQKIKDLPGENLSQTFKALLLLPIAGWVFWMAIEAELPGFLLLPRLSLPAGASAVAQALIDLLIKAAVVLLALGAFDFWRQRRKVKKKLMMSKHEVRQEHKDVEGNPQIKARLRRMQRELMRRRMMSQVPEASVVITNPTHYAVAIKYKPDEGPAPTVVAKGVDSLALRIRKVAEEHGVPIVENPPLAQALHKSVEVGEAIPAEMYRAVAELLAYIYRLRGQMP